MVTLPGCIVVTWLTDSFPTCSETVRDKQGTNGFGPVAPHLVRKARCKVTRPPIHPDVECCTFRLKNKKNKERKKDALNFNVGRLRFPTMHENDLN